MPRSAGRTLLILTLLAGACAPAAEEPAPVTTFLDASGRPLANLRVTFWADGRCRAFDTDAAGRAAVDLDRGVYDVVARKERPWPWKPHGPGPRWSREDVVWRGFGAAPRAVSLTVEPRIEAPVSEPLDLIAGATPDVQTPANSGE